MNKMNFFSKAGVLALLFGAVNFINAQNLDLRGVGQKILSEVEGAFTILGCLSFAFVAYKAFNEYQENGKDVWSGIKVFIWYVILVLVFIALYKFLKGVSLS